MRRHELIQEAHIVFGEEAQVVHLIFQVRDAFHTHTEGITLVHLRIDAVRLKYRRVDHAAAQDLHPTGVFAEAATLAAADVAGNVHFGRRLSEGEIRGTQADLRVGTKHFSCEGEEYLFQVGE